MDVHVKLARAETHGMHGSAPIWGEAEPLREIASIKEGTLENLLQNLVRNHPEFAPILEDAPAADDVEILVNNKPVRAEDAEEVRLQNGDTVSLFLKEP